MSKRTVTLQPDSTVQQAAAMMSQHNIGAVPVETSGQVRGIVTDRDLVLRCIAEGRDAKSMKISDVMTKQVETVCSEENVHQAIRLMGDKQIRRLVVTDQGRISGMISLADIARNKTDLEVADALSEISMP